MLLSATVDALAATDNILEFAVYLWKYACIGACVDKPRRSCEPTDAVRRQKYRACVHEREA